jgi:hypothetical protein
MFPPVIYDCLRSHTPIKKDTLVDLQQSIYYFCTPLSFSFLLCSSHQENVCCGAEITKSYMTNGSFCIVRENFGITEAGEKYFKLNSE